MVGAAVAVGLGVAVIGAGHKTDACAFGFPPWGNYSKGRIVCDGATCHTRESPRFDEFFDTVTRTYNQTAMATLIKGSQFADMPGAPRYAKNMIKESCKLNQTVRGSNGAAISTALMQTKRRSRE